MERQPEINSGATIRRSR